MGREGERSSRREAANKQKAEEKERKNMVGNSINKVYIRNLASHLEVIDLRKNRILERSEQIHQNKHSVSE